MERVKLNKGGRGGYRPGSGRKPGSGNKRLAQANIDAAKASGMLPHEFLLAIVRGETIYRHVEEVDPDTGEITSKAVEEKYSFEDRKDAAKAGAPYFAPRISTVEVIQGIDDDDLDAIIARAAAEAGIDLGALGAGTSPEDQEGAEPETRAATTRRRVLD